MIWYWVAACITTLSSHFARPKFFDSELTLSACIFFTTHIPCYSYNIRKNFIVLTLCTTCIMFKHEFYYCIIVIINVQSLSSYHITRMMFGIDEEKGDDDDYHHNACIHTSVAVMNGYEYRWHDLKNQMCRSKWANACTVAAVTFSLWNSNGKPLLQFFSFTRWCQYVERNATLKVFHDIFYVGWWKPVCMYLKSHREFCCACIFYSKVNNVKYEMSIMCIKLKSLFSPVSAEKIWKRVLMGSKM